MQVHRHRRGLSRVRRALERGRATLGYVGGSITDGRTGCSWPEPVTAWFVEQFPAVRVTVENAAIGATGSDSAVFRAERDLIGRGCDLVFIEYAVNDYGTDPEPRRRSQEGLIRKLLSGEGRDIVLTYTYSQPMYEFMSRGELPPSIRDLEELGEHYGIGSVWMGLHALSEVNAGLMRWEEWLPDGLHPQARGSLSYAQSVIAFLRKELVDSPSQGDIPTGEARPAPLNAHNWEHTALVPFSAVKLEGPWTIRRWLLNPWIDEALCTSAIGAKLRFEFEGRGLALAFDFGKTSSEFRWRLEGGEWTPVVRERPDWRGPQGSFYLSLLADNLPAGRHDVEIEVTHGNRPDCTGTNFHLGLIGVIR